MAVTPAAKRSELNTVLEHSVHPCAINAVFLSTSKMTEIPAPSPRQKEKETALLFFYYSISTRLPSSDPI